MNPLTVTRDDTRFVSKADLQAAFLAWETDRRLNPDKYLSDQGAAALNVQECAERDTEHFWNLLSTPTAH